MTPPQLDKHHSELLATLATLRKLRESLSTELAGNRGYARADTVCYWRDIGFAGDAMRFEITRLIESIDRL